MSKTNKTEEEQCTNYVLNFRSGITLLLPKKGLRGGKEVDNLLQKLRKPIEKILKVAYKNE